MNAKEWVKQNYKITTDAQHIWEEIHGVGNGEGIHWEGTGMTTSLFTFLKLFGDVTDSALDISTDKDFVRQAIIDSDPENIHCFNNLL
ncbi:hypothetical protein [Paenibacillus sp. IHBB 10380]|uniref:hypothetical protein n=1 Tax=Paenibacillus sp. IHBB 10380 TaxID=1566358 RepID=UPI0005CFE923|nr:hypothetical protein [Paenibacillus sp. IHBB 10380]AJS59194.1 hypothetical protein UB51_12765 [Paenibacillus sp. IHBB 10380]